ncbi:MAG: hypothetical protein HPY45_04725 [Anaerolineae bacterium]|nr:hypothetical protein [Anaerolineae bacterium]
MEKPHWDILGLGCVAVDDLLYVKDFPTPDTKVMVNTRVRQGGGLAGTAMVAAARLGASAAYCGVLGDDELSRYTISELEREGVDCSVVLHQRNARPVHSTIIVEQRSGRRTILFSRQGVREPPPRWITEKLISRCRVLFVDSFTINASLKAAKIARGLGIPVVADIEARQKPHLRELADLADHLIVGIAAGRLLTGRQSPEQILQACARPDRACCVITVGEHGCWFSQREGEITHIPAVEVEAVDTTGCGDVFHGVYAAMIAQGKDIPSAVRLANLVAGIKATQPGGRKGIPTLNQLEKQGLINKFVK